MTLRSQINNKHLKASRGCYFGFYLIIHEYIEIKDSDSINNVIHINVADLPFIVVNYRYAFLIIIVSEYFIIYRIEGMNQN